MSESVTMTDVAMKLLEMFEDSIIIQSVVTLITVGAMVYMGVQGKEIPESLRAISFTIIGFWFGSKVQRAEQKHLESLQNMDARVNVRRFDDPADECL